MSKTLTHPPLSGSTSTIPHTQGPKLKSVMDRQAIATRICSGELLFIYHSLVINASAWAAHHPGGVLAILHFVGRDATDEVEAYHSIEAIARIKKYAIGRVEYDDATGWPALTPPIALGLIRHTNGMKGDWKREGAVRLAGQDLQRGVGPDDIVTLKPEELEPAPSELDLKMERQRSKAYHELKEKLVDAGLFNWPGPLIGYGRDLARYSFLGLAAFGLFFFTNNAIGQLGSALFLGLFYHQLTFLAHDAGHTCVTGNWWWDRMIGMLVANYIGGLSLGWWCDNHNIHHLVTNHPEHDPDIQHIPFFAISKQFFGSLWSTYYKRIMALDAFSKFMIPFQHKIYYVVLSLARFNLYANSYGYLAGPKPKHGTFWKLELGGVAFYWMYFGGMLWAQRSWQMRLGFLLVSHVAASPVHVQIVLSHFACSTDDLGPLESFPSRQLRTTMDVVCSEDIEFVHGGLHLQVTHHLFPRMPRHNLRKASLLVKEYCAEQDIKYLEHGWIDGNRKVLGVLEDVANQLQFLKTVADAEIEEKIR